MDSTQPQDDGVGPLSSEELEKDALKLGRGVGADSGTQDGGTAIPASEADAVDDDSSGDAPAVRKPR